MEIFISSVLLSHRNPSGMLSWEISGILDNLSIFQNSINEQIPARESTRSPGVNRVPLLLMWNMYLHIRVFGRQTVSQNTSDKTKVR